MLNEKVTPKLLKQQGSFSHSRTPEYTIGFLAKLTLCTSCAFAVLSYKQDHFWNMPRRMLIYAFSYNGTFALKRQMQNYFSSFSCILTQIQTPCLVLISNSDKIQIEPTESRTFCIAGLPFMMQTAEVTHDFSSWIVSCTLLGNTQLWKSGRIHLF